jgi:glycosyltransferase involved in cell wall biosynthesis
MRIMIASSTYAPSMNGQAVFTTNLAEGLVKGGHKVLVVLDSHHGDASQTLVNGVQVVELRSVSLNALHAGVYFSPFPGWEVRRLLEAFQPEIVHIQDHYPICRAVVHLARKHRIKIVGSNHFIPDNLAPYIPGLSKIKPVFNWVLWHWMLDVYKHVDVISAQSNAAVKLIQHQGLNMPILPISCGIDLQLYHPNPTVDRQMYRERFGIDPQKKIFLFLGRIDGEKRIDLLIRAMQRLFRDDIQMVIAGHGKVEDALRRMAADMHINQNVRFIGFIPADDVPGLMNSVDVFVMPSEAELLSISTLEAMACGRPVLLANALALPELVRDGENGYLFKPGDVKDLVRLMHVLADQPERWESMGKISREIAQAHSLDDTIQKFELIYSQLATQGLLTEVKLGVVTPV